MAKKKVAKKKAVAQKPDEDTSTAPSPERAPPATRREMVTEATGLALSLVAAFSEITGDDRIDVTGVADQIAASPNAGPESTHTKWVADRAREGWCCGKELNEERREDPRMVPFRDLSASQQSQSQIFHATIRGLLAVFDARETEKAQA